MAATKAHLVLASAASTNRPLQRIPSGDRFAELFAPLGMLLAEGGDDRLTLAADTGLNVYGCQPRPRTGAISFSSSTATSISDRAYWHARAAQERLIEEAAVKGLFEAFETRMEYTRQTLLTYLDLTGSGVEVVLSPSGTDAQLHALFFAKLHFGDSPVTSVIVGSDQTGSGTIFTATGRHFNARIARGKRVLKGSAVGGWNQDLQSVGVPFSENGGQIRSAAEMDRATLAAVEDEIRQGRCVVLQAMHASKFGWQAPSDDCIAQIAARWPQRVSVAIDACQMRIGRAKVGKYLDQNYLVLVTGSKYFTGQPFSGALLVPSALSNRLATLDKLPSGLGDYATRSDFPLAWLGIRSGFALEPNFGQWLRWETALEEMRHYYALSPLYRQTVLIGLAEIIPQIIDASDRLELVPAYHHDITGADEEFSCPTIFSFLIRGGGGYLNVDDVAALYRALNRDMTSEMSLGDTRITARQCQIGQPVAMQPPGKAGTAALRIAVGSRTLFEAWSVGNQAAERAIQSIAGEIQLVVRKIELLLRHRDMGAVDSEQKAAVRSHHAS
jgi:hypothetical protein